MLSYSNRLLFTLIFICIVSICIKPAYAATYYVDFTSGKDTNNGTSQATPWQSLTKVSNMSFTAGDSILFKRGQTWRGILRPRSSGTSSASIRFADYGTGTKPLINGSQLVGGWTLDSGNIWKATVSTDPPQVFFNHIRGIEQSSKSTVNGANKWYWSSNTLFIYSTSNPNTAFTNPGIEATVNNGIDVSNRDYITIENIDVTKANYGIWFHAGSQNGIVKGVETSWNYRDGIAIMDAGSVNGIITNFISHDNSRHGAYAYSGANNITISNGTVYNHREIDGAGAIVGNIDGGIMQDMISYSNYYGLKTFGTQTKNITIQKSRTYNNMSFGIDVDTSSSGIIVQENEVYNNDSHGIAVEVNTPGTIVRYNIVHDNAPQDGKSGIEVESGVDTQVYYNVIYNEREGIALYGATNPKVYNNTIYNASDACINVNKSATGKNSSGITLRNNTVSNCGYYAVNVRSGHTSGFSSNYNNWQISGAKKMRWNDINYSLENWRSTVNQDNNSLDVNPQFVNPAAGNFRLTANSPLINKGTSVTLSRDTIGSAISGTVDIGAYEYVPVSMSPTNHPPTVQPSALPSIQPSGVTSSTSLRFYGTGSAQVDRVEIPLDNPERPVDIGATDFTIEFWMKSPANVNTFGTCQPQNDGWITGHVIIDRDIYNAGDYGDFGIALTANGNICFGSTRGSSGNTIISSGINIKDNNWHHIAVTRSVSDGSVKIFIDGIQRGFGSGASGNISYRNGRNTGGNDNDPFLVFGAEKHDAGSSYPSYNGFLDDVRISNNLRYTENFTRPSATLQTDTNTVALYNLEGTVGNCMGTVADTSGASGGPSNATCMFGGGTNKGPVYVADNPYSSVPPTSGPSLTPTPVLDLNKDNAVNLLDIEELLKSWFRTGTCLNTDAQCDLNKDEKVNSYDYAVIGRALEEIGITPIEP